MASLLSYFLCWITGSTAAVVIIGLVSFSAAERVRHYPHPRPVVERNDKELGIVPKTIYGSPAKNIEATQHTQKGALKRGTNGGY